MRLGDLVRVNVPTARNIEASASPDATSILKITDDGHAPEEPKSPRLTLISGCAARVVFSGAFHRWVPPGLISVPQNFDLFRAAAPALL